MKAFRIEQIAVSCVAMPSTDEDGVMLTIGLPSTATIEAIMYRSMMLRFLTLFCATARDLGITDEEIADASG